MRYLLYIFRGEHIFINSMNLVEQWNTYTYDGIFMSKLFRWTLWYQRFLFFRNVPLYVEMFHFWIFNYRKRFPLLMYSFFSVPLLVEHFWHVFAYPLLCRRCSKETMINLFIERKTVIKMMVFRFFYALFLVSRLYHFLSDTWATFWFLYHCITSVSRLYQ